MMSKNNERVMLMQFSLKSKYSLNIKHPSQGLTLGLKYPKQKAWNVVKGNIEALAAVLIKFKHAYFNMFGDQ